MRFFVEVRIAPLVPFHRGNATSCARNAFAFAFAFSVPYNKAPASVSISLSLPAKARSTMPAWSGFPSIPPS